MKKLLFGFAFLLLLRFQPSWAQQTPSAVVQTDRVGVSLLDKSTYRFSGGPVSSFATSATDWITLSGGSATVRVTNITICGIATSAASIPIKILKRSAADSGGTSTAISAVPLDSNDPPVTATGSIYTGNPTLGSQIGGNVDTFYLNLGASGSAGCATVNFSTRNGQALVLHGPSQQVAINFGGDSLPSGASLTYRIEETEGNVGD